MNEIFAKICSEFEHEFEYVLEFEHVLEFEFR